MIDITHNKYNKLTVIRLFGIGRRENCRWATKEEQMSNTRHNTWYEYKGEIKNIAQWASKLGINYITLYDRLKKWSVERALTTPVRN